MHSCLNLCICKSAVSEPTLKLKLKKLINTRPNPLQRKISAPPAVKHRTETLGKVSALCCIICITLVLCFMLPPFSIMISLNFQMCVFSNTHRVNTLTVFHYCCASIRCHISTVCLSIVSLRLFPKQQQQPSIRGQLTKRQPPCRYCFSPTRS